MFVEICLLLALHSADLQSLLHQAHNIAFWDRNSPRTGVAPGLWVRGCVLWCLMQCPEDPQKICEPEGAEVRAERARELSRISLWQRAHPFPEPWAGYRKVSGLLLCRGADGVPGRWEGSV